jgi:hypothetical protein
MPPSEFSLRLQHGIVGGFMPATPLALHTVTLAGDAPHTLTVSSALPPPQGEVSVAGGLQESSVKSLSTQDDDVPDLLDELHAILKMIPTESPPGSEDIYGMNISIAWGSEDLQWQNQGPDGCIRYKSETQPTEEDKAMFRRAVEIVNILVGKARFN